MGDKQANITEGEWPIMAFLWKRDSATAAEIVGEILRNRDISMRTVKSLLSRLISKGAVTYSIDPEDARVYHYRAAVSRDAAVEAKKNAFLGTVFDNNPLDLLAHFVNATELSPQDLDELRKMVDKKLKDTDGD